MKILTFAYTKADGSESERMLLTLKEPSDMYAGIDLSELDIPTAVEFDERYDKLHQDFLAAVKELQAEYDLTHNYRQFKADRMSQVCEV